MQKGEKNMQKRISYMLTLARATLLFDLFTFVSILSIKMIGKGGLHTCQA